MNSLLSRLMSLLRSRSTRERWLLASGLIAVLIVVVHMAIARPLQAEILRADAEVAGLETQWLRAIRMAGDLSRLQGALAAVEQRIEPGAKTNLFTLLEALAAQSGVKDQLDSMKPKQTSDNAGYPETRVEVSLKGVTLAQMVEFIYKIENAPSHLIIRSIRLKVRASDSQLLDVSFSVSSFERA